MAAGWWFEVRHSRGFGAPETRWLVGIPDAASARERLAQEVSSQDRILSLREASVAELERYGVGPRHVLRL